MRHATWLRIEASSFWYGLYRRYRILPGGLRAPMRALAMPRWQLAAWLIRARSRGRVFAGPFRGMKLLLSPVSRRHHLGYLLGSRERELHEAIERIVATGYGTVVNVGAADGYYAVGLALRSPGTRVIAFEALAEMHPVIARVAALNRVGDRVAIFGACGIADLRRAVAAAGPKTLVVMDIEGGEAKLLDPRLAPELRQADILVETHDAFVPGVTDLLIERFVETHAVECHAAQPRAIGDFPDGFLSVIKRRLPRLAVDLMNERRAGQQCWLFLRATGR